MFDYMGRTGVIVKNFNDTNCAVPVKDCILGGSNLPNP
jgi:hypothetical protein